MAKMRKLTPGRVALAARLLDDRMAVHGHVVTPGLSADEYLSWRMGVDKCTAIDLVGAVERYNAEKDTRPDPAHEEN